MVDSNHMPRCAGIVGCVSQHLIQLLPSKVVLEVESVQLGNHPRSQEVHLLKFIYLGSSKPTCS